MSENYDEVQKAKHYESHPSGVAAVELLELLNWNLGTVLKYVWRRDIKGSAIKDLEKACWYLKRHLDGFPSIDVWSSCSSSELVLNERFRELSAEVLKVEPAGTLLARALRLLRDAPMSGPASTLCRALLREIQADLAELRAEQAGLLPSASPVG
jgi:hypothetical protein